MVDATLRRAGPCESLFMIPPGLWSAAPCRRFGNNRFRNQILKRRQGAALQSESLPRTCRLLCSLEIGRTLFKKCCERFLCFSRTHSRGELFVLDFYRLRDLLALRMLHQSLASLQSASRFRSQLLSCFGRGGKQFFVGHNTGD